MDYSSSETQSAHNETLDSMTYRSNVLNLQDYEDTGVTPQIESVHTVQKRSRLWEIYTYVCNCPALLFHLVFHLFVSLESIIKQKCQNRSVDRAADFFESQVKTVKEVLSTLKTHAVKAEEEYGTVIQYLENMKDQSVNQEDGVDKTMNEINVLKEEVSALKSNLGEKRSEITDLKRTVEKQKENLSSAEGKFKFVAEQLLSVVSPNSNETFERKQLKEIFTFVVDNIGELKNKMHSQNNLIKRMSRVVHSLDEVHKVNKNINQRNAKMNNLKVGLRRKSDSLVGNLKNIADRFHSVSEVPTENFHGSSKSLSKVVETTELFLGNLNLKQDQLEEQNDSADEVFIGQAFNDLWRESSASTVINVSSVKNNATSSHKELKSIKQVLHVNNDFKKTDGVQLSDSASQTSPIEESDDPTEALAKMQNLQRELNALRAKYECAKKRLRDFKLEKSKAMQIFEQIVYDLKSQVKTLSTQKTENSATIMALKNELKNNQNLKQENADLKARIVSKDKETELEKKKIEEVLKFEQENKSRKVIQKLEQNLKSLKKDYEETAQNAENISKVLLVTKNKLVTEKKYTHSLKKHCETVTKDLSLQIETQKTSLSELKSKKEELEYLTNVLNKKISCLKLENDDCIKKKEAALTAYRNSFKQKDFEIELLKEENKKIRCILHESKESFKFLLKQKDSQSNQARVTGRKCTVETTPAHVTFRRRKLSQGK